MQRPTDLWIVTNILKVECQSEYNNLEALDSIKWHTLPGMGSKTLDIPLHYSTLQFFVPKVLIEMPAHTYSFIVILARLVCARAHQSDLRTSKST